MSPHKDCFGISFEPSDVPHNPGDGSGGIVNVCRIGNMRVKAVIYHSHSDSLGCESSSDDGSKVSGLIPELQASAVEPDEYREMMCFLG